MGLKNATTLGPSKTKRLHALRQLVVDLATSESQAARSQCCNAESFTKSGGAHALQILIENCGCLSEETMMSGFPHSLQAYTSHWAQTVRQLYASYSWKTPQHLYYKSSPSPVRQPTHTPKTPRPHTCVSSRLGTNSSILKLDGMKTRPFANRESRGEREGTRGGSRALISLFC